MWEPAVSWWCVAFYRLGGIRSADPIAFVAQTIASGLSDRCSAGYGFRPADLSISTATSALKTSHTSCTFIRENFSSRFARLFVTPFNG